MTPFFPVAYHHGAPAISAGLESAHMVHDAVREARHADDAGRRLIAHLGPALMGVERVLDGIAHDERVHYAGIDTSPAPLGSVSIGAAIETLSGSAFGDAGTLDACATLTAAIKALPVRACGYCGLMLPVLEDDVLARARVGGTLRRPRAAAVFERLRHRPRRRADPRRRIRDVDRASAARCRRAVHAPRQAALGASAASPRALDGRDDGFRESYLVNSRVLAV